VALASTLAVALGGGAGISAVTAATARAAAGQGIATVAPTVVNFGSVKDGSTVTETTTVENTGTGPITNIGGGGFVGGSPFQGTQNCAGALPLEPGQSCSLFYSFTPTTSGPQSGSTLLGFSGAVNSSVPISLSGTGLGGATATLAQSQVQLGASPVGSADPLPVSDVLTNTGTANITAISVTGLSAPFSESDTCAAALPLKPGAHCTLTFGFTPAAAGTVSQTATVTAIGADNSPISLPVSGTGEVPGPGPLTVLSVKLPSGVKGVPYTGPGTELSVVGGTGPYTWKRTAGTLPAGLSLTAATGVISGKPTLVQTKSGLVFRVTDSTGATALSRPLSIKIAKA
jgi:hypothetical protein